MKISSPGSSGTLTIHVVGSTGYTGTVNFRSHGLRRATFARDLQFQSVLGNGQRLHDINDRDSRPPCAFSNRSTGPRVSVSTFGLTLAGVVVLTAPRRRRLTSVPGLLLLAWLMTFSGCGGGSSSGSGSGGGIPGTPAGQLHGHRHGRRRQLQSPTGVHAQRSVTA